MFVKKCFSHSKIAFLTMKCRKLRYIINIWTIFVDSSWMFILTWQESNLCLISRSYTQSSSIVSKLRRLSLRKESINSLRRIYRNGILEFRKTLSRTIHGLDNSRWRGFKNSRFTSKKRRICSKYITQFASRCSVRADPRRKQWLVQNRFLTFLLWKLLLMRKLKR